MRLLCLVMVGGLMLFPTTRVHAKVERGEPVLESVQHLRHIPMTYREIVRRVKATTAPFPVSEGLKASLQPMTPAMSALPPPVVGALYLSEAQVASYLRQAGFPESAIPTMVGYARRESNFCPSAVNPGHCPGWAYVRVNGPACGLLQLFPCYGGSAWLDPLTNARAAREKCLAEERAGHSCFHPWGG